jgi:DNA-directed RNA polymerase specialized sigma24 family protein
VAKKPKSDEVAAAVPEKTSLDRIAKLLAILATKGETQSEQIVALSRVGFSNPELAQLLGTTSGNVGQTLYTSRKAPKRRVKKPKPD